MKGGSEPVAWLNSKMLNDGDGTRGWGQSTSTHGRGREGRIVSIQDHMFGVMRREDGMWDT
jgi:hypothetical protein